MQLWCGTSDFSIMELAGTGMEQTDCKAATSCRASIEACIAGASSRGLAQAPVHPAWQALSPLQCLKVSWWAWGPQELLWTGTLASHDACRWC